MKTSKTKIGIISLYDDNNNYGGVLQAYALTKYLNNKYNAEQISFTRKSPINNKFKKLWYNIKWFGFFESISSSYWNRVNKLRVNKHNLNTNFKKRQKAISSFKNTKIPHSQNKYNIQNISQCKNYDVYMCGSDQIWSFHKNIFSPAFWLTFLQNKKKISYAASPILKFRNNKQKVFAKNALRDFDAISVRENENAKIIDSLIEKKSFTQCVLDPVFLLNKEEWNKISKSNNNISSKYVFVYLFSNENKYHRLIKEYAKENNLTIVSIPHLDDEYRTSNIKFANYEVYEGPEVFLGLIKNAEVIFTDSYHALTFSLIFNKKFIIFERINNKHNIAASNNRLNNLANIIDLELSTITKESCTLENVYKGLNNHKYNNKKLAKLIELSRNFTQESITCE